LLENSETNGWLAIESARRIFDLGAELNAAEGLFEFVFASAGDNISQASNLPVAPRLDDNIAELLRVGEPPKRA
jgi:hypothetical protein